jgi:hypothetical protein
MIRKVGMTQKIQMFRRKFSEKKLKQAGPKKTVLWPTYVEMSLKRILVEEIVPEHALVYSMTSLLYLWEF